MNEIPEWYRRALWWSMERLGVAESVERKIVAAVTIQFGVAIMLAVLPFALSGGVRSLPTAVLLGGAAVAFANTLLITRRDFVTPVKELEAAATTIAEGELDAAEVADTDQADEIGSLVRAFDEMRASLETISAKADALARADFDADALDEPVPGSFGDDLGRMTDNLRSNTRELEALTDHLERTADDYGDVMAAAADKDLSVRMDPDDESAAMASIARSFNRMLDDLEGTMAEVYAFADTVAERTVETSTDVDEVVQASEDISAATAEIEADADEQRDQLQRIVSEMSDLSAAVEEIAASADSVAEVSTRTAEMGDSARESATDVLNQMDAIESRTAETMSQLSELDERMTRMGDIVATISDIAERTNLLALNASIEAAHSGEGFAVVADEVKSLAEETQSEATRIQEIIEGVQTQTTATVEGMQRTTEEVEAAVGTVEDAIDPLERIAEHAAETDEGMQEITDATDQQAASTETTVSMIERIEETSDETATEATSVAAAAEAQADALADVSTRVDDLSEGADALRGLLSEFELTTRDADADADTTTVAGSVSAT